jgi:hypothetical protein
MHHRIFRLSLIGVAGSLITLFTSMPVGAAISNGPKLTNAAAAEEQRIIQFHQAEESYQEKLKVGKKRYEEKQLKRAAVIAAMAAELRDRQRTVLVEPFAAPDAVIEEPSTWLQPMLPTALLLVGLVGYVFYRNRRRAQTVLDQKRQRVFDPIAQPLVNSKANPLRSVTASKSNKLRPVVSS